MDKNLTITEQDVLRRLKLHYNTGTATEMGTKLAIMRSLERRGLVEHLGNGRYQLTESGEQMAGKDTP